jgi:peptidoglycan DL-endopeptidase CwlO
VAVLITVLTAVLTVILALLPVPAFAQPDEEDGNESLAKLRENLAAAAEGLIKAESDLAASKSQQAEAQKQLQAAEADITRVKDRVADYAVAAYQSGRLRPINILLRSSGPGDVLGRAQMLDTMSRSDIERLTVMADAKQRAADAKATIDSSVAAQTTAAQEMAKRKVAAERALAAARVVRSNPGIDSSGIPIANPAPRNSNGSWPPQGCTLNDPTTSGCITGRTLHALNEAKRVGFTWYVSCFRPGNRYEHPKGRACDFAAFPNGFENRSATGANRNYGDRLAAFFVKNASALGVMYVVWFCQIWQYGVGWHRYNSAGSNCGDAPAGDHTNHVHLSVY